MPLRHGGFGLRTTSLREADAALQCGVAAMDQAALNGGTGLYLPFKRMAFDGRTATCP